MMYHMQIFNTFHYNIATTHFTNGSESGIIAPSKNQKEHLADEQKLYRFKPILIQRDSTN